MIVPEKENSAAKVTAMWRSAVTLYNVNSTIAALVLSKQQQFVCWHKSVLNLFYSLKVFFSKRNKAVVDITLRSRCVICCHCIRQLNGVAPPGEYFGNFHYLLQHGAHVAIANARRHIAHCVKIWRHTEKPEVHNILHCSQRRNEPWP